MLKDLIETISGQLNLFFKELDIEKMEALFPLFSECKGLFCLTGVGKSGLVTKKIASTLTSYGIKALYMNPTDALHGDMGMLSKEDIVLLFSKSGETEELLHLIPYIRNRGAKTVAITSSENSRLSLSTDHHILLPMQKELCPYDLAPTTSTTVQAIFGDILAVALMKAKNVSLEEYAQNHPAGQIGKRASVMVRDLMLQQENLPLCAPQDSLVDVLEVFSQKKCGCLLVVDENKHLQGIFTDGDLRRALQSKGEQIMHSPMNDLMTKCSKTISPASRADEALKIMEGDQKHPITVLPVIDKQKLIGLIKMHDIIQAGL